MAEQLHQCVFADFGVSEFCCVGVPKAVDQCAADGRYVLCDFGTEIVSELKLWNRDTERVADRLSSDSWAAWPSRFSARRILGPPGSPVVQLRAGNSALSRE